MKQRPPLADAACVRLHSPCRVGRRLTLLRLSLWHLILTYCRPNFCSCSTCVRPQPLFYAFLRARGPHAVRPLCVLFRPWPFLYVLFRPFCAPARPCVWPLWPLLCLFWPGPSGPLPRLCAGPLPVRRDVRLPDAPPPSRPWRVLRPRGGLWPLSLIHISEPTRRP